ncbi:MAG: LacI family DNA-binding transcriptional regulator [Ktedonobacteraceae bacterium]|nr:LacI family DNA-binding transcriptional regulator [Ktedonobacteraceae bacterium]
MSRSAPTTRDVAQLAGVSLATVSYVLNGRRDGGGKIGEATREKVLRAVAELGYVPNQSARHLRRQKTERICVVLPNLGVPYFDALVQDVQNVAEEHGYTTIIAYAGTFERERRILEQIQCHLADGALIVDGRTTEKDLVSFVNSGIPLVIMRNHTVPEGFDVVETNEREACYEAISYLIRQGRRHIAFLGHFGAMNEPYDRFIGYQQALRDGGIAFDERLVSGGAGSRKAASLNVQRWLNLDPRPDAIFATSDKAAISIIWTVRDAGLRVPEDVAIIGVGNIPEGESTSPPLTTVGPASSDFRAVAQLLFSRLADGELEARTFVHEWTLIRRGSA